MTRTEAPKLPDEFFRWLESSEGQSALEAAATESRSSIQRLTEERTIQPEHLHVPVVL